ncbi:Rho GTPase activation protein [Lipomyces oligophaga]|uniref:Rho GTPase activation protein n=1 Tax=Lipomyces oligophaga TaxID=45792 RepID=UPI0034CDA6B0
MTVSSKISYSETNFASSSIDNPCYGSKCNRLFSPPLSRSSSSSFSSASSSYSEDDVISCQDNLCELKEQIRQKLRKTSLMQQELKLFDSQIAILIQNRLVQSHGPSKSNRQFNFESYEKVNSDLMELFGKLLYLLQVNSCYISFLCSVIEHSELYQFLTALTRILYGNQHDRREERLLLKLIQSMLTSHFEQAKQSSTLLRANTPTSHMLSSFTGRDSGQHYLALVLEPQIRYIINMPDPDLEIDPYRVFEQVCVKKGLPFSTFTTGEEAAEHKEVQALIESRVTTLLHVAKTFISSIIAAVDQVPFGIRWLCKQIQLLARRKYPEASDSEICTFIGAFFFLRFITPAIVTPHKFKLIDSSLTKSIRRSLTLVAKMLQSLVNGNCSEKESYMFTFSAFYEVNKWHVQEFLNELCNVPDFDDCLELDDYVAAAEGDIHKYVSTDDLYFVHKILEKYSGRLNVNESKPLLAILRKLGSSPTQSMPSKIELPFMLASWREKRESNFTLSTTTDKFAEARFVLVQIIQHGVSMQFQCSESAERSNILDFERIVTDALISLEGSELSTLGFRAQMVLQQLLPSTPDQNYLHLVKLLSNEIIHELHLQSNLKEKMLDSLQILECACERLNSYMIILKAQLDSYQSYLCNAFSQICTLIPSCRKRASKLQLPVHKFSPEYLLKQGVVLLRNIPPDRVNNLYFQLSSCINTNTNRKFTLSLFMKQRQHALFEADLSIDELQKQIVRRELVLDLFYFWVNTAVMLEFLELCFPIKK